MASELKDTQEKLKFEKIRSSHDLNRGMEYNLGLGTDGNKFEAFCRSIINEQDLEDFDHLKRYIMDLINNNRRNKQEIREMKKLLHYNEM